MKCLRLIGLSLIATLAALNSAAFAQQTNWGGFYSGISLGYVAAQSHWSARSGDSFGPTYSLRPLQMDATSIQSFNASAPHLGVFLGYNWQKDNLIYGVEAELSALHAQASKAMIPGVFDCPVGAGLTCTNYSTVGDRTSVRLGWNGSLRARLGFLVTPQTLLFATTGLAIAGADVVQACQFSYADPFCAVLPFEPSASATNHKQLYGFVIGAGLEHQIDHNWHVRADYLFTKYNNVSVHSAITDFSVLYLATSNVTSTLGINTHRLSLSLVRKF